jgi:hypothetical protein
MKVVDNLDINLRNYFMYFFVIAEVGSFYKEE